METSDDTYAGACMLLISGARSYKSSFEERRASRLLGGPPHTTLEGDFAAKPLAIMRCADGMADQPARPGGESGCVALWPATYDAHARAILLIDGVIHDWSRYRDYLRGLREARLLQLAEAVPFFYGPPLKCLEGEYGPDRATVCIGFPSRQSVHDFWTSRSYAEIRELRRGAADLDIGIWQPG